MPIKFTIPDDLKPSGIRKLLRRTLFLRLLDGEFVLWCYETDRITQQTSDVLKHSRVSMHDPVEFSKQLAKACKEVGVRFWQKSLSVLIIQCVQINREQLTPIEKRAMLDLGMILGIKQNFILPHPREIPIKLSDDLISLLCHDVGSFFSSGLKEIKS